jgi:hypothetical protein
MTLKTSLFFRHQLVLEQSSHHDLHEIILAFKYIHPNTADSRLSGLVMGRGRTNDQETRIIQTSLYFVKVL